MKMYSRVKSQVLLNTIQLIATGVAILLIVATVGCRAGIMRPVAVVHHADTNAVQCLSMFSADTMLTQKQQGTIAIVLGLFLLASTLTPAGTLFLLRFGLHQRLVRNWRYIVLDSYERFIHRGRLAPKTY